MQNKQVTTDQKVAFFHTHLRTLDTSCLSVQNLLYEGLVSYGAGGAIEPALAESWDIVTPADGVGETAINFRLRRCVGQGGPREAAVLHALLDARAFDERQ